MADENTSLPDLEAVLERLNSSLDDFASCPAKSASDKGAFGDYPLHKVVIWGDLNAAEVLIANRADVNAAGEDDDTPLHRAVAGGHADMIRLLLSKGADANLANRHGNTPAKDAEDTGKAELISVMRWSSPR